jgi:hypothetical protein
MPQPTPQTSYALGNEESGFEGLSAEGLLESLLDQVLQNAAHLDLSHQPLSHKSAASNARGIFNDFLNGQLSIEADAAAMARRRGDPSRIAGLCCVEAERCHCG